MIAAARVVPAVPSFSVDKGFWYSLPDSFSSRVHIGSMVRIPLGGRRTRGYVVELADRDPSRLKPIGGVSGDLPVFDEKLGEGLKWLAHHYVAPVAVALERAAPPNLPSAVPPPSAREAGPVPSHDLSDLLTGFTQGRKAPITCLLTSWDDMTWLEPVAALVSHGHSFMVVTATATETSSLARHSRTLAGDRVLEVTGELDAAEVTRSWSKAAGHPGHLLIGTPRVASWPMAGLAGAIVIEESRRAMKDRQTPTVAVRRLITARGRLQGFGQVYIGPTPSVDLVAAGASMIGGQTRAWPLVEVVDRTEEPPGSGLLTDRARGALDQALQRGWRAFVFTHRRGYAPAFRCVECRELRRCPGCGSRPEPGEACIRCGEPSHPCTNCGGKRFEPLGAGVGRVLNELGGRYRDEVGDADSGRRIIVGTERDLASLESVDLAVVVDADGLSFGSNYRAGEEALRILARVAGRVARGNGRRLILQTSAPQQPLVVALRRGDPLDYLRLELEERRQAGYPPASDILVVEASGEKGDIDSDLRELATEALVMGPAPSQDTNRWLVQGEDLGDLKLGLRAAVQRWRDSGSSVRIDVDPIDL